MKASWETETGQLKCHWCEGGQSVQRTGLEEVSETRDRSLAPTIPDFARHSPLGSGEWIAPWNVRWSLPTRT